jgi:hypothetical protein
MLLTEAALIREAYLVGPSLYPGNFGLMTEKLKESELHGKDERRYEMVEDEGERYH